MINNFDHIGRVVHDAAARGIHQAAEAVMAESDSHVPIESGRLDKSSKVSQDELEAVVSYDEPYAVIQHENMREHHDPGRHAKFLEQAGNTKRREIAATVAAEIRRALGT